MRRKKTGTYDKTTVAGETVRAFIPEPLPPIPEINWSGDLQVIYEKALGALGRLDGVASFLPSPQLFLYSYVRKEALLSSQIEGTQSSLSDLLSFEAGESPAGNFDDIKEVSNYVAAMEFGLERLRKGVPVSNRLLREIHEMLLHSGRGNSQRPGEFRKSQNWIGGTRPGNAKFVPPPHTQVPECMSKLEKFVHDIPRKHPTLIKAALAHVQFETIHPFLDGNGRVGRLLITLLLCAEKVLREPLLYLSLYFKEHRDRYYELLQEVRLTGDWEAWLEFFLEGVNETATGAVKTAESLHKLFSKDREKIKALGRMSQTVLQIQAVFERSPFRSAKQISSETKISSATVGKGLEALQGLGILKEVTGRKRNRVFCYSAYLKQLSEGTTPLAR